MQCFVDGQCIRNCIVFEMGIIAKRYFGIPTRINGRNHRSFASWQVVRSPGSSNLLLLQIDQICVDKRILDFGERTCRGGTSSSIHEPTASSKSGISSGEQPFSKLLDQDGFAPGNCRRVHGGFFGAMGRSFWGKPDIMPPPTSSSTSRELLEISKQDLQWSQASKVAVLSRKRSGQRASSFFPRPNRRMVSPLGREFPIFPPGTNLNLDFGSIPSLPISL